jgi:hypothetical protein
MNDVVSLSTLLSQKTAFDLSDDQGGWRQYILDHLDVIAASSQTYTLTPNLMYAYRYDLQRFLTQEMKQTKSLAWIVQLLNGWSCDFDFDQADTMIIPSQDFIQDKYNKYQTVINAR